MYWLKLSMFMKDRTVVLSHVEDFEHFADTFGCEYGRALFHYFGVADEARPTFNLVEKATSESSDSLKFLIKCS